MKLSVIIPVYNVEKYIKDCIETLYKQNLKESDFEIILINDGSTDRSLSVCKEFQSQKTNIVIISQQNRGQSAVRNKGLEIAKGEYIYFIDSDDFLSLGYLNLLLDIIYCENLDFLGFSYALTKERNFTKLLPKPLELEIQGDGISIIGNYQFNNGPCWYIFQKNLLEGLRFEEGRLCEDGLFTAQLLQKVKNGKVFQNKIYNYFDNETSVVKTKVLSKQVKMNIDMFFAANYYSYIIDLLPREHSQYQKAYKRLKDRQESYTFFAFIRFFRRYKGYKDLVPFILELKETKYPAYPINSFDGYGNKRNKFMIKIINNTLLLNMFLTLNKFVRIVK